MLHPFIMFFFQLKLALESCWAKFYASNDNHQFETESLQNAIWNATFTEQLI